MPNWCSNFMTVSGRRVDLLVFKHKAETVNKDGSKCAFSFEPFIPMPKELENTTSPTKKSNKRLKKKYGADNWYDWKCQNYGCKWDVDGHLAYDKKTELAYSFDSPWGPPGEGVTKLGQMFPTLTFTLRYEEPGMGFMGVMKVENGEVIEDASDNIEWGHCDVCKEESYRDMDDNCGMCGEPWKPDKTEKK